MVTVATCRYIRVYATVEHVSLAEESTIIVCSLALQVEKIHSDALNTTNETLIDDFVILEDKVYNETLK